MPAFIAWRSPAWRIRKLPTSELGDLPAATEQGLGVAALAGLGDGVVHVGLHGRERLEVGVEDLRGLVGPGC